MKDDRKNVFRSLAMISQFGINMIVPVFLCSFAGIWLDKQFGCSYLMIAGFFLGALAGFRNIYILAKRIFSEQSEKNPYEEIRRIRKEHRRDSH